MDAQGLRDPQPPILTAAPGMYWANQLAALFPSQENEGLAVLKKAAEETALAVFRERGINSLATRAEEQYRRASGSKPFPSMFFAIWFDLEALRIYQRARHGKPTPRKATVGHFTRSMMTMRAGKVPELMPGGMVAFYIAYFRITGEKPPATTSKPNSSVRRLSNPSAS